MKFVNCPHCSHKVSLDSDSCPICGKIVMEYAYAINESDYDRHYSDFMSSTYTPRGIFQFQMVISMIMMLVSLYIIFYDHYSMEAPDYAYFMFLAGFLGYVITRLLILKDKKSFKH